MLRRSLWAMLALSAVYLAASAQSPVSNIDLEAIDGLLNKPTFGKDKKVNRKVQILSVLIAAGSDNGGVQETALKLGKAAEANNLDEAKKLFAALKVGPKGKAGKIDWVKELEFENVMRAFSGERVGGFGLEKLLDEATEAKGALDAESAEKFGWLAKKTAVLGDLVPHHAPEKDMGKKTKALWNGSSAEMKAGANELAAAVTAKKGEAVAAAATKVSAACVKCHDIFR